MSIPVLSEVMVAAGGMIVKSWSNHHCIQTSNGGGGGIRPAHVLEQLQEIHIVLGGESQEGCFGQA